MITPEKKQEILRRLEGVNVREMCQRAGVKRNTFYATLNNESSQYEVIEAVLEEAEKEKANIQNKVNSL